MNDEFYTQLDLLINKNKQPAIVDLALRLK